MQAMWPFSALLPYQMKHSKGGTGLIFVSSKKQHLALPRYQQSLTKAP
jgi:hypothetical protein